MDHWPQSTLGMNTAEASLIIALLTLLVTIPAAVPPVRSLIKRSIWRLLLVSGITRRRYNRWFVARNSKIQNIYLNRIEELDLAQTYVTLSFLKPDMLHEQRVVATSVLADPEITRMMIVGDPGTGKSTLLTAYGVGILQRKASISRSDLKSIARSRETPFLVRLRHFAVYTKAPASLTSYLADEILLKQAGIKGGMDFLQRILQRRRCLILLDGLDEVSDDHYDAVRDAIIDFMSNDDHSLPGSNARIVISCRRQNFLRIQTDWNPTFCSSPHVLAPLRDGEIFTFLLKRKQEFAAPRTPETFFSSIKASGTMNLHRVPLILTISLGLYLQLAAYEIPRSVGKFYEAMINELLIRHDFRGDPTGKTNRFNADDKYRFLREFAFAMAIRTGAFEDFSFQEIISFARNIIPKMSYINLRDTDDFVKEIIDRSGILTRISDEDEYIFAHRSIQEYLIAVQLIRDTHNAVGFLLEKASDSEWRQVILFFSAFDHQHVEMFLKGLSEQNLELAGQCLGGAGAVPEILVEDILSTLSYSILNGESMTTNLAALVSITGAQKDWVRERAVEVLSNVIRSILERSDLVSVVRSDSEGALRLLQALADTDAVEIAAVVPALLGAVSIDDERAVDVLWRCLAAPGIESESASGAITSHLLSMVMEESRFNKLQHQPAYEPSFVTDKLRKIVYPFRNGLDIKSNLVTLLCWAEYQNVEVSKPNRYLEAKKADVPAFNSVERDWQRRTFTIHPFLPARAISLSGLILALILAVWFIAFRHEHGWHQVEFADSWIITVGLYIIPGTLAFLLATAHSTGWRMEGLRLNFPPAALSGKTDPDVGDSANLIIYLIDQWLILFRTYGFFWSDVWVLALVAEIVTLPYAIVTIMLVTTSSILAYLAVSTFLIWLMFWFLGVRLFDSKSVIYLRRPNRYVNMYEDAMSRHWIVSSRGT